MKNIRKNISRKIVPLAFALGFGLKSSGQTMIMSLEDQISSMEMDSLKIGLYDSNKAGKGFDSIIVEKFASFQDVRKKVKYTFVLSEGEYKIIKPQLTRNGVPDSLLPYDKSMLQNAWKEINLKTKDFGEGIYVFDNMGKMIRNY